MTLEKKGGEKYMLNKRIVTGFMSIAGALAIAGGATFAYFTGNAESTGNTFSAGTMKIEIRDQNQTTPFRNEAVVEDWKPGDAVPVEFDIQNTGSLPVRLSGFASGEWEGVESSTNVVKVIKVERWNGSGWEVIKSATAGIEGAFYYTNNGNQGGTPFIVDPNGKAQLKLTVEFDKSAGDEYQGKKFKAQLNIFASQTNAPWPTL